MYGPLSKPRRLTGASAQRQFLAITALLTILSSGCSASGTTRASSVTAIAPDVTDYRGDLSRRGLMPGPGLDEAPVMLWRHQDPTSLGLPPAVAGGQVLIPEDLSLLALDLTSGDPVWSVALGATINAPITVSEGTAFVTTTDGLLHAIDLSSHRERWQFAGAADGGQVSVQDDTVYLGTRERRFVALNAATGAMRWSVETGTSSGKNAIVAGVAYVGGDGGSTLTAISLTSQTILWSFDTHSDRIATPSVAEGTVYLAGIAAGGLSGRNTNLFAIDAATGEQKWTFAAPMDQPMAAFAVGQHDVLIGVDAAPGTLYAIDRVTGQLHWQSAIAGAVDRPALVGDVVYVAAGPGGFHAFDLATGDELWSAAVDGYSEGVVLTDGIALVASRDAPNAPGTITAFIARNDPRATGR